MAAIQKNPWLFEYVKNQTPEICMIAVKLDGLALQFVRNKTPEICRAAVSQNINAVSWVDRRMLDPDEYADMLQKATAALYCQIRDIGHIRRW